MKILILGILLISTVGHAANPCRTYKKEKKRFNKIETRYLKAKAVSDRDSAHYWRIFGDTFANLGTEEIKAETEQIKDMTADLEELIRIYDSEPSLENAANVAQKSDELKALMAVIDTNSLKRSKAILSRLDEVKEASKQNEISYAAYKSVQRDYDIARNNVFEYRLLCELKQRNL